MINCELFGKHLKDMGFDFFSGVPCSFLKYLINYAINECSYVAAANEGDAVAVCAGAHLAGKKSVVLMQNSGLTNAVSPLTSLNYPFKIPSLGFVSLRGEEGINDEPQHELMGTITTKMLDMMEIEWAYLSKETNEALNQLNEALKIIKENRNFFFVVKKGSFSEVILNENVEKSNNKKKVMKGKDSFDQTPSRLSALETINRKREDAFLFATTGKTGRELYETEDNKRNLYMVGSMGTISSLSLGFALNTDKKAIAIDGDGSLIMRMGSLATNGTYSPANMLHIVLDNGSYDSTGGQSTVSDNLDLVSIASSCGYHNSFYAHNLSELEEYIDRWHENPLLTFICMKIAVGSKKNLGRPALKPFEVKDRLMAELEKTELRGLLE